MSDRFVNAYDKDTGLKHRIPAAWLDHPTLGARWRKTPKTRAKDGTNTDTAAESATPATDVTLTGATDLDTSTTSSTGTADSDGADNPDPAAEPKE